MEIIIRIIQVIILVSFIRASSWNFEMIISHIQYIKMLNKKGLEADCIEIVMLDKPENAEEEKRVNEIKKEILEFAKKQMIGKLIIHIVSWILAVIIAGIALYFLAK